MKLRLQTNSIRFRLKRGEVAQLVAKGFVEESICFGSTPQVLTYRLEISETVSHLVAQFLDRQVLVLVPSMQAKAWLQDESLVGLETTQQFTGERNSGLDILVEKDFACLNADESQNVDTYPNPHAGPA